jgi:hypothetical protein
MFYFFSKLLAFLIRPSVWLLVLLLLALWKYQNSGVFGVLDEGLCLVCMENRLLGMDTRESVLICQICEQHKSVLLLKTIH